MSASPQPWALPGDARSAHALLNVAASRAIDQAAIAAGTPELELMERAGAATAAAIRERWQPVPTLVLAGPGNNGGDGFVAARVLRDRGVDAVVYLASARTAVQGDARIHLEILERTGGAVQSIAAPAELVALDARVRDAALVIDALFGVGLTRLIEGHMAEVVACMRGAARVLAVDIPSGLDADTAAVKASLAWR